MRGLLLHTFAIRDFDFRDIDCLDIAVRACVVSDFTRDDFNTRAFASRYNLAAGQLGCRRSRRHGG